MAIKLGNLDISSFKVGSGDCSIYLGETLVYSGGTPPTPTYEWVSYSEGDTVPSSTIYGVKLYAALLYDCVIDFGFDSGITFTYENNDWTALDIETFEQIDISSYFDYDENCYIILFSDLGYGGLTIYSPQPEVESFECDIDLYEESQPTPQTLQWVSFSSGDTIPSNLDIYGVSGNALDISSTFYDALNPISFTPNRNKVDIIIACENQACYSDSPLATDTVSLIFSDIGCCDYVNQGATVGGDINLYIYAE